MNIVKSILIKYWYLFLLFFIFFYHSWLMQMFPWQKQILNCELFSTNIKRYNVPKTIGLNINGWGSGKFTNEQYFGSNSFSLNTNGNRLSGFFVRIIGSWRYDFNIHVKEGSPGYEWGDTHWFWIPKKKQSLPDKNGKLIKLDSRILYLLDSSYDGNEMPEAIWDCYDQ